MSTTATCEETPVSPLPAEPPAPPRKVAIIGFAASSMELAPVNDPSWDIWGLNQLWQVLPRWDVWFELHPKHRIEQHAAHHAWLQQQEKPIVMQEKFADIPASIALPKDELVKHFGDYFTSSIAWMIALAITQEYKTIGVWGVDMLGEGEYAYQRACCDYWIGFARGAGVTIHIPDESALAKGLGLYGYEWLPDRDDRRGRRLKRRQTTMRTQKDKALQAMYMLDGGLTEVRGWDLNKSAEYQAARDKELTAKREQSMQSLYALDGALQEITHALTFEKHYGRGGA